ncbi:MAG: VCBS repeat-containing protein, partial [Acidobacteria bacterium]|nr:VCBS repeat-containing protein [Acidobacteriota bacterium]
MKKRIFSYSLFTLSLALVASLMSVAHNSWWLPVSEAVARQTQTSCTGAAFQSGTLAAGAMIGQQPQSVTVADFNNDSKPDLAITNYFNWTVTILLGNGSGGFSNPSPASFNVGTQYPYDAVAQDFNRDGKQDLEIVKNSGQVVIWLGNGDGTFTENTNAFVNVGLGPRALVAGDFNNDTQHDLAVVNYTGQSVSILLGNGQGRFTTASTVNVGGNPSGAVVADFNRDGRQDLAVSNFFNNGVDILLGNGTGGFSPASGSPILSSGQNPSAVASGDFNGDNLADLALSNYLTSTVMILRGNGNGTFAAAATYNTGTQPSAVVVA